MYSAYKLNKQGDNIQPWLTLLVSLNPPKHKQHWIHISALIGHQKAERHRETLVWEALGDIWPQDHLQEILLAVSEQSPGKGLDGKKVKIF